LSPIPPSKRQRLDARREAEAGTKALGNMGP
jgi:hypothetical protein